MTILLTLILLVLVFIIAGVLYAVQDFDANLKKGAHHKKPINTEKQRERFKN
ncbi:MULTISPECIES: hypothetical protein [unclassified Flavobacterium]|uniref:hypothetical protein n=1 Tax=unclassified Flavobacterium TaxID=196869 RepID=UPI0025C59BA3|nr:MULTISPECIES: hypothetical protein [unclassified Flavobacterium]